MENIEFNLQNQIYEHINSNKNEFNTLENNLPPINEMMEDEHYQFCGIW